MTVEDLIFQLNQLPSDMSVMTAASSSLSNLYPLHSIHRMKVIQCDDSSLHFPLDGHDEQRYIDASFEVVVIH